MYLGRGETSFPATSINNSDYVPNETQIMAVGVANILVGIMQLMLNMCVVATMCNPSHIISPMCHVCIFHGFLYILMGFIHMHETSSSLISTHQSGLLCHIRFISILLFRVMIQWNVLAMILCSILMVHPGRPFMYIFVSTKYFLLLTLFNAILSSATVFLIFSTGTSQIRTSCTVIIVYSSEARWCIQGTALLVMIFMCSIRLWRHFRGSCPVSPDCIDNELKDKRFSTASKTLLIYSICFMFFTLPRNVANVNLMLSNHVTFFWYYFAVTADIIWNLGGIVLFPICFARHPELQTNFYSMICFKCMIFNSLFHQDVEDTYQRATVLREVLHDPERRARLKTSLQRLGNNRLSSTCLSGGRPQRTSTMSQSTHDHRLPSDSLAEKETVAEVHDVNERSASKKSLH